MLIIEKNAVYEVDCECLQKKRGRYANLTCEERQIEKEQIIVPTGGVCKESLSYRKRRNGSHFGYRPISAS